jgi:hypothetical protein
VSSSLSREVVYFHIIDDDADSSRSNGVWIILLFTVAEFMLADWGKKKVSFSYSFGPVRWMAF